jgi:hypothetical protein
MVLFKKQRSDYSARIITELLNCKFGAVKGSLFYTKNSVLKDFKEYQAIKVLLGVLENYTETGNATIGSIPFPEIGKSIYYSLSRESLDENYINIKN